MASSDATEDMQVEVRHLYQLALLERSRVESDEVTNVSLAVEMNFETVLPSEESDT